MELASEYLRATEENPGFRWRMNFANGSEYCVPVRSAKTRGRSETGNSVCLCVGVIELDVHHIVRLDLGGKVLYHGMSAKDLAIGGVEGAYRVYLDVTIHVLCLNRTKQALEPLKAPKISAHPKEVDFA